MLYILLKQSNMFFAMFSRLNVLSLSSIYIARKIICTQLQFVYACFADIVAAAVLSGNRNFEGRVHPLTRANYLASPPLVVAYALAGTVCFNEVHFHSYVYTPQKDISKRWRSFQATMLCHICKQPLVFILYPMSLELWASVLHLVKLGLVFNHF